MSSDAGSESGKSYGGLANGSYTLSVSLSLTDGGGTSVTRHFTIARAQTISFTAPTGVSYPEADFDLGATATSGLPVSYSSKTTDVCTIVSGQLHVVAVGSCTIDADQAGNDYYLPAPQVEQTFEIAAAQASQTISFTSAAPTDAAMAGQTYTPTAEASSGLAVAFSVDPSSSSVCAISDLTGAVNFIARGTCTLDADQAGDADWLPAPQATQSFQVGIFPLIVVINPVDAPQSPPLPPNPGWLDCDPQTIIGGGCYINPLDGSSENIFDATGTIAPTTDTGFDPNLYDIGFHWRLFKPPGLSSAPYSSNGITGYHADVLDIQPDSLPELLGTDAGSDFYWRVELTVTINGVTESGFFKFQYQSSTLSLQLSIQCQDGELDPLGTTCQIAAANGLSATEQT